MGNGEIFGPISVCRAAFQYCWGISDHHRAAVIKSLKESEEGYNIASNVRSLDDHSRIYENYSTDSIAKIFVENIVEVIDGERALISRAG